MTWRRAGQGVLWLTLLVTVIGTLISVIGGLAGNKNATMTGTSTIIGAIMVAILVAVAYAIGVWLNSRAIRRRDIQAIRAELAQIKDSLAQAEAAWCQLARDARAINTRLGRVDEIEQQLHDIQSTGARRQHDIMEAITDLARSLPGSQVRDFPRR